MLIEIPAKFIEKFRTYTNDEFREFVDVLKSDIAAKSIADGSGLSDPDILRLMKCVLVIQVLLERVEAK